MFKQMTKAVHVLHVAGFILAMSSDVLTPVSCTVLVFCLGQDTDDCLSMPRPSNFQ